MRFTYVFIPTLLFASTALCQRLWGEPYAGYKTELPLGNRVGSMSAVVKLPNIKLRTLVSDCAPNTQMGFILLVVGDYRNEFCIGPGFRSSIEAGIALICGPHEHQFKLYWALSTTKYDIYDPLDEAIWQAGDKIRIQIDVDPNTGVWVSHENLTRGSDWGSKSVGSVSRVSRICLATAMWVLKAAPKTTWADGTPISFWEIPAFNKVEFMLIEALDKLYNDVGYIVPEDPMGYGEEAPGKMYMKDPVTGNLMAAPYHIQNQPFAFRVM